MKKFIHIFFIGFLIFFSSNNLFSQEITIVGEQEKHNQNIKFVGQSVYVPEACTIKSYFGDKTAFSLRIQNINRYQFYFENNKFNPPLESVTTNIYFIYLIIKEMHEYLTNY